MTMTSPQGYVKVFVLLSGGVDSSTTLAIAAKDYPDAAIECVTVDYGQRHKREMESAAYQANLHEASHIIIDAQGLLQGMLVDKGTDNEAIPDVSYAELAHGISPTYVSFRNGTMLSLLAARAQSWVMEMEKIGEPAEAVIYCGVHADDGVNWAYPDCTPEFIGAMANAIYIGTYGKVRLRAPLQYFNKAQIVREGLELDVDFKNTWSCYKGDDMHCGTCPTCRSRREAFIENGAAACDVEYADVQAASTAEVQDV